MYCAYVQYKPVISVFYLPVTEAVIGNVRLFNYSPCCIRKGGNVFYVYMPPKYYMHRHSILGIKVH